jgi:beta-N-acetylhexosaminidase
MREVERLSISELCGQLLVVGYLGSDPDASLLQRIRDRSMGGVILFGRNVKEPAQVLETCRSLHGAAPLGYPIFVAVDQEGGRVARLKAPVLQLPAMRALGLHDDPELTERLASELGRQLLALGFNVDFAPVADVDSNPRNPVIGDRSFGRDPALVSRHVRAFSRGLEAQGVIACLKHFPGHGDTAQDSHLELPVVKKPAVELRRTELYPFERAGLCAHAVMTAHVVFPAFDRTPATLSPRLLSLLRTEFAFDGVIFSDDLEMKALAAHWPIEETAVRAVEAGCDALLVCSGEREVSDRAHTALVHRAERDGDFRARCERAAARSLALRQRFPQRPTRSNALHAVLTSPEARSLTTALSKLRRQQVKEL